MRFGRLKHLRLNKGFVFLPKAKPSVSRTPCSTFFDPFSCPLSPVHRLPSPTAQMWKLTGQTGEKPAEQQSQCENLFRNHRRSVVSAPIFIPETKVAELFGAQQLQNVLLVLFYVLAPWFSSTYTCV